MFLLTDDEKCALTNLPISRQHSLNIGFNQEYLSRLFFQMRDHLKYGKVNALETVVIQSTCNMLFIFT